ncbi:DUF3800 domain-containing protein [Amycolatopsis lurida]
MADVYLYMDETGDFDMSGSRKASSHFGLGSALFVGDHRQQVWEGMQLRFQLEAEGNQLPKGLHAHQDQKKVRYRVFDLLAQHRPRLDVTLLRKDRAYSTVLARIKADQYHLYEMAWYLHFKFLARYVIPRHLVSPDDRVFIIAASLGEGNKKKERVRAALESVCEQFPRLNLTLCVWDSTTSWGLQVADYGLWTTYRRVRDGFCQHYATAFPSLHTVFRPWEGIKQKSPITTKAEKQAEADVAARPVVDVPRVEPVRQAEPDPEFENPDWWEYVELEPEDDRWADFEPDSWDFEPDPDADPWFDVEEFSPDHAEFERRRREMEEGYF